MAGGHRSDGQISFRFALPPKYSGANLITPCIPLKTGASFQNHITVEAPAWTSQDFDLVKCDKVHIHMHCNSLVGRNVTLPDCGDKGKSLKSVECQQSSASLRFLISRMPLE